MVRDGPLFSSFQLISAMDVSQNSLGAPSGLVKISAEASNLLSNGGFWVSLSSLFHEVFAPLSALHVAESHTLAVALAARKTLELVVGDCLTGLFL